MKKSKWIKMFDIERSSQAKWSNLSIILSIGELSSYIVYLLRAMGYKCKALQGPNLDDAILYPRVVYKKIDE